MILLIRRGRWLVFWVDQGAVVVCSVQEILRETSGTGETSQARDIGIVLAIDNSNKQWTRKLTTVRVRTQEIILVCDSETEGNPTPADRDRKKVNEEFQKFHF